MQASYAATFTREMGCTVTEWLRLLPAAIGDNNFVLETESVEVQLPPGKLSLCWQPMSPRVIGLARFPRLMVQFAFEGLNADQRYTFMKRFDLYTHRGGG